MISYLPNEENVLDNMVAAYKAENKLVHVIRGDPKEVKHLNELFEMEDPNFGKKMYHSSRKVV